MSNDRKENDVSRPQGDAYSRWRRCAIAVSVVFHVLLLSALVVWYVGRERKEPAGGAPTETPVAVTAPVPPPRVPEPSPDVSAKQVSNTLKRTMEQFAHQENEQKLSELEQQAARLEELASAEAVDEIAQKFHEWMNTAPRAGRPAEQPVEGEFDYSTAQIHEVARLPAREGEPPIYRATLVDTAGRTLEVDMNQQEGERAYQTLQTIKNYPLADKVYRQIAMPLIDQAIEAQRRNAARAQADTSGQAGETDGDHRDPFAGEEDDRDPFDEMP